MTPGGTTLVGRAQELAELGARLDRTQVGPAEPILLVGEAGMGKTALLEAVAGAARGRGMRVVRARSPEGADASPFALVADVVRGLSDDLPLLPPEDADLLRRAARDSSIRPGLVARALLELLAESAHRKPVLVVLDDLHWADRDSVAALCLAVGRLQSERVAVVGAARPRPAPDLHLQAWTGLPVTPLDIDAATRLLRRHLTASEPGPREPLDHDRAATVAGALGCCPLALIEAGRLLTPDQLSGSAPLPDPLPVDDHLTAAWGGVWEGLPQPIRTAMLAFCVTAGSGPQVLTGVLADLGLSQDDLDPQRSEHLVVPADGPLGVDLAHPLIRGAVLAAAGPPQVRGMHHRAAIAAEALGESLWIITAHLAASAVPGDEATIAHLLDVVARALSRDLPEAACRALLAAAALTLDAAERAHLAVRALGLLLARSSSSDGIPALALVDPSITDCLSPDEQLWLEWARAELVGDLDARQSTRAVQATAAHARAAGSPMLSWTLLSVIYGAWSLGDADMAVEYADALLDLAQPGHGIPGDPLPAWACRAVHAVTEFQVGRVVEAGEELSAVREESRAWQPPDQVPSQQMLAVMFVDAMTGLLDPWIDDRLVTMYRWFLRNDGDTVKVLRCLLAERARRRGEFATARALLDEVLGLLTSSQSQEKAGWLGTSILTRSAVGGARTLRSEAAELRHYASRIGWPYLLDVADRAEGLLALGEGRIDDALLHLEPLADDRLLGAGPWDVVPTGRADLVEALARAGATARASEVAAALQTTLGPSPDPFARGLVARVQGLVCTGEEARAALAASVAAFGEAGDPFEEARSRLLLGELLRRERQIEPARRELRLAAAAFERMGAAPWYARAVGELRATRAAVPPPTPDPLTGLTPQERRVAEAVAAGGTDRQVAADLFLSARTVGYHLANVYRKLGVSNRTALAARLAEARTSTAQAGPG